jgi:hypothetical protein
VKTFKDNAGRTWTIAVTVDAVKRVRDLLKEDLLDVENVLKRLMVDPILLCDVIYCVCKPQADAEQVTDVQFGQAMAGDTIAHAKTALVEEIVNFSPDPRDRENLGMAVEKFNAMADRARELIKTRLQSPALTREIEAALSAVGVSFTSSPESPASTPDR